MHKEGEQKKQWLNAKAEQGQEEVRRGGWGHPHSGSIMGVGCHISNAVAFAVQWIIMALLLLTFMCFELRQIRRRHAHKMKKESSKNNAPPSLGESVEFGKRFMRLFARISWNNLQTIFGSTLQMNQAQIFHFQH